MFKVVLATITIVVYRSLQCHSFSWHPHHVMSSRRHASKPWIYAHKAKSNNVNDGADNDISAEREGSMAAATKTLGKVP